MNPDTETMLADERAGYASASTLERTVQCAGWRALAATCPPEPPTEVTVQGENIHAAIESGGSENLSAEEADIARSLEELERQAVEQWRFEFTLSQISEPVREERLWINHPKTLRPLASAKLDCYRVDLMAGCALVIDFKSGFKDATASERNWQLRTQALALWNEHPSLTHIRVVIAQSRLTDRLDQTDYDREALENSRHALAVAIWQSDQPDAPRRPGTWCRYCPAKGYCREALHWASLETIENRSPLIHKPDKAVIRSYIDAAPLPSVAAIIHKKSVAVAIFEAAEERMRGQTPEDLDQLGLKLRPTTRSFIVNQRAAKNLLRSHMSEEAIEASCTLSKQSVIKNFPRQPGVSEAWVEREITSLLAPVTEKKTYAPAVVPK